MSTKNKEARIIVKNITKEFKLPHERSSSLKSKVLNFGKRGYETFRVLNDISLTVNDGEFFGILGRNGSGKSTLLKIIAGLYQPTKGKIETNGRVTTFIELGIGFNAELTGRENIFLNGAILGLTQKEIEAKYDEIVAFAELERFMDQKLKNYSSGMQVRLAFSVAIQAHTDILIIDEVLAVGDSNFQRKCFEEFKKIKNQNKTVVFVSHDMGSVAQYCDKAILLEDSEIIAAGNTSKVIAAYSELNQKDIGKKLKTTNKKITEKNHSKQYGTGEIKIKSVALKNAKTNKSIELAKPNDKLAISVDIEAVKDYKDPVIRFAVCYTSGGTAVMAFSTKDAGIKCPDLKKGEKATIEFKFNNIYHNGPYVIHVSVYDKDQKIMINNFPEAYKFESVGWKGIVSITHPKIEFDMNIKK